MEAQRAHQEGTLLPLGELHQEIVSGQASRAEFWKWKIILIAGLGAVGMGIGVDSAIQRVPLVLCCIPLVCAYVDLLTRHMSIRSHAIAAWRVSREPRGSDPFQQWEEFKDKHLLRYWGLEDIAKYGSSAIANAAVAFVGFRVPGGDGTILMVSGLLGVLTTVAIWLVGRHMHGRLREIFRGP